MKLLKAFKIGLLSLACCSAISTATAADSVKHKKAYNDIEIYAFFPYLHDDFTQAIEKSLATVSKNTSIQINIQSADNNLNNQLAQIRNVVDANKDKKIALLVDPVDIGGGEVAMRIAKKANLPIIFFHRKPADPVLNGYDKAWFVGHNNNQAGKLQAAMLNSYIKRNKNFDKNGNGKIDYVMFKGDLSNLETEQRTASFETRLSLGLERDKIGINKVYEKYCFWSRSNAKNAMKEAIDKVGIENIEAVISNNDEMALGAIEALSELGYNKNFNKNTELYIPVFGIDGTKKAVDKIKRGEMTGTVYLDTRKLASTLVRLSVAEWNNVKVTSKLAGIEVEGSEMLMPYKIIKAENFIKKDNKDKDTK